MNREGTPLKLPDILSLPGVSKAAPKPPARLPITLYDGGPDGAEVSDTYAPYGRLIPCETVITIDSAKIETPIIGFVTEDVYHNGRLVIPAGAEVHGKARTDRSRERIASDNQWYIVWRTTDQLNGAELVVSGLALDMERDYANGRWAITDGSAGLRGDLIKSDNWAEIKLFAATFLSAAAGGLQDNQNIFNPMTGGYQQSPLDSPKNAALQGTSAVLNQYAQQIADSIKQNGFYVRVPAGKQFYLYVMQTLDQEKAHKAESLTHSPTKSPTP
ncbi:TrbI/VirB10 family protein [Verrucomicrobium sp. GAS474]|uniref:TrbI/VirB10 family protein n=1 Tax=Verrucomicrobium sp. GAS474 TaxID=1882831 RepID=UPI0012FF731A|nr:TrbI/VirB10 family protein [Verrucomicrobium sp. GAS474]